MKQILFICLLPLYLGVNAQKKTVKKTTPQHTRVQNTASIQNNPISDTVITSIRMIAQNYGDSIVVRWAPGDAVAWMLLQKPGYVLRRTILSRNAQNEFKVVDSSTIHIKPWSLETWGQYFKATQDTMAAAAAQLVYGKSNPLTNTQEGLGLNKLIEKYEEQNNRFTFGLLLADFKPGIATGLGFRYVEKAVKKDLHYLFSVVPAPADQPIRSDTGRSFVSGAQIVKKDTASAISAISGDKVIFLFWLNPPKYKSAFSGYFIERSEDGKNFRRLNRLPYLPPMKPNQENQPFQFEDSVHVNYKKFYYRLVGVNAFGDFSHPSNIVGITGVDLVGPAPPQIIEIKNLKGEPNIQLKWEKKNQEPDFKGFVVGRSHTIEGPYDPLTTELMDPKTMSFTDKTPMAGVPNYYIVAAVDTAGNANHSLPAYVQLEDHIPPAKPTGLKGNIDTLGSVTIQWNAAKENDLAGYKLFFSNAPDHIFTPLTGALLEDTLFMDSIVLKTLTKKIYYQVITYDRAMNASPVSDMLELSKPDRVAPTAATIYGFVVNDSGVTIKWNPSVSNDVAQQKLFRKKLPATNWELLAQPGIRDSVYSDKKTIPGMHYEYAIETVDSSGLSSGKSFGLKVYAYENSISGEITQLNLLYIKEKQAVSIKWKIPKGDILYYILYRGKSPTQMRLLGNIQGNQTQYEDPVSSGNYSYALKAIYSNGNESAISEIKSVEIP